ncbi:MAG TPA: tetratricopeptide repeat protein [Pirellulales bacterium]
MIGCLAPLAASEPLSSSPATSGAAPAASIEKLVESARRSVVVIRFRGRDGSGDGLGSGFIVKPDGLIATNLHVIGEARPIAVETFGGRRYDVTTIEASDREADLALLRIDAQELPALELGDSTTLKQGQSVVALGNPHGLTHSVVTGVVSGERTIDGQAMIQLAIPIEPGNSGGPLLDREGRVHGLLTMKSLVTANLGFAVPINRLKLLLEKPNPVPIDRWLLFGALDDRQWTPLFGARWRRRGGKIVAEGPGNGFGGRSLCLSRQDVPETPYEVAVTVRLNDEAGAAGLVFASDGGEKHFGFYPSAGKLRLTQFDGPDVTSWQVLAEQPSDQYVPGGWNKLKVRVERERVVCSVNDHPVIESTRAQPNPGRVGLAKFRDTRAEFKEFVVARQLPDHRPDEALVQRVDQLLADHAEQLFDPEVIRQWSPVDANSIVALRDRAAQLDGQAAQLRRLADTLHQQTVLAALAKEFARDEAEVDLIYAALLVARLDNDELDVEAYRQQFDQMTHELKARLPADADEAARLAALDEYLFKLNGFHGSRTDYYNRRNSYINEVLDDREGIPITLSLVYIELARRLGLDVVGIGLPGHFVVEFRPRDSAPRVIDVYASGQPLSREQVAARVLAATGQPLDEAQLAPVSKRAIVVRMLGNLHSIAARGQDMPGVLRYLDAILVLTPESAEDRMYRAFFRYRSGQGAWALEDLDWLIANEPPGIELDRVRELRDSITARNAQR